MRKTVAAYAQQSDPAQNRQFRRRWTEAPAAKPRAASAEPIRLIQIPAALNADGEPRAMLEVPPAPGAVRRVPDILTFRTMGEAIAAKRRLEASR